MLPPYRLFFEHFHSEIDLWLRSRELNNPTEDCSNLFASAMSIIFERLYEIENEKHPTELECFRMGLVYRAYRSIIKEEAPDLVAALDGVIEAHRIRRQAYEDEQKKLAEKNEPELRSSISAPIMTAPDDENPPAESSSKHDIEVSVINADPEEEEEDELVNSLQSSQVLAQKRVREEEEEKEREKRLLDEDDGEWDDDDDEEVHVCTHEHRSTVVGVEEEDLDDEEEEQDDHDLIGDDEVDCFEIPSFEYKANHPPPPPPPPKPASPEGNASSAPKEAPNAPIAHRKKIIIYLVTKKPHH